jgi:hypothetical protein
MLSCVAVLFVVFAVAFAPATAGATSRDVASTHTYLEASYKVLHAAVSTWSTVEGSIHRLDLRFHAECPDVGAGSPQNEEDQKLSYEVAGALWATGYHTDAAIVHAYVNTVNRLTWSNPQITRDARKLTRGLQEMTELQNQTSVRMSARGAQMTLVRRRPTSSNTTSTWKRSKSMKFPGICSFPMCNRRTMACASAWNTSPPGSKNLNSCAARTTGLRYSKCLESTSSRGPDRGAAAWPARLIVTELESAVVPAGACSGVLLDP